MQLDEKIRVAEYARLADRFTAEKFDAEAIAQLAQDAGMRYVNLTTRLGWSRGRIGISMA